MSFNKKVLIYIGILVLGFALGYFCFYRKSFNNSVNQVVDDSCKFQLINPLRCDGGNIKDQVEYSVFKQQLVKELEEEKAKGNITDASLYFRDLRNGPIFYFNEQEYFSPMSLLKLPVMIAVYKYAENDPKILEQKLRAPSGFAQNSQIMDFGKTLSPSTEYTLDEIVKYMIIYSDNRAIDMLASWLDSKGENHELIRRTLSDLGVVGYEDNLNDSKITVKQYVSIFRILYNASYLNPEMSDKALSVLKLAEFKEGLTGKLPNDLMVAHKFGIRAYIEGEQQLHDCGIVYFEKAPYMICIMTRGRDYKNLSNYIQNTSKKIFEEVRRRSS